MGDIISNKVYDDFDSHSNAWGYIIFDKDGNKGLLDVDGVEFFPANSDYLLEYSDPIYFSSNSFIATDYSLEIRNKIVITDEHREMDTSSAILDNIITPRIQVSHDLAHGRTREMEILLSEYSHLSSINTLKLFKIDDFDNPILYFYSEPKEGSNSPASSSAFYSSEANQIDMVLSGCESGGSIGGNYVQLHLEKETSKIILGAKGHYGGFGGYASERSYYQKSMEQDYLLLIGRKSV